MAPKSEEMQMVGIEQGGAAEAAIDGANEAIDSMTNTAVFFSLQTESLRRNG
jgi:hypothetical protein